MKVFCLIFIIASCLAQGPIGPGAGSLNSGPCPNGQCGTSPSGSTTPATTSGPMPATGTDPSTGGQGGTPNPTDPANLLNPTGPPPNVNRPCRRYDLQCVRYFFKDHSHCKKPLGKVPEPFLSPLSNQFYPGFNITTTHVNAYYTGINSGRIVDFYVNRQTDKVVLTVDFTNLTKASNDVLYRFHRRAREPIVTAGYSSLSYPSLLLTVTIPQVDDLRLDKSDSFGYANTLPVLTTDPKIGQSSGHSLYKNRPGHVTVGTPVDVLSANVLMLLNSHLHENEMICLHEANLMMPSSNTGFRTTLEGSRHSQCFPSVEVQAHLGPHK